MKKYFKLLASIIFVFILSFLISNKVSAVSDYTIKGYDIDMVVNEDNTFDITERITAFFDIPKHGIYRKIPLTNTVKRNDGTSTKNRTKISNISVNKPYSEKIQDGYKVLQIGDSDKTVKGTQIYVVKYTYDLGKDPLKDADELYYNLIGSEWDTSISNISFKITMPKEFDSSTLGFSSGSLGKIGSSDVTYNVNGNVITGTLNSTLYNGEALTVRLMLPEGYFVGTNKIDFASIGIIILCLSSIIGAYILWSKYGKDDEVVETVEFYPPEGYNSAEIGFLYKGTVENEDVVSLLIYLANKGYLKIEEIENKVLFSTSKGFRITKLKDYDGNNEAEKIFFDGLFWKRDSVTDSDLYNRFYLTIQEVAGLLNREENVSKIFEKKASNKSKWLILTSIIIFILITIRVCFENGLSIEIIMPSIFIGIGLITLMSFITSKKMKTMAKIFIAFWVLQFAGIPFIFTILPILVSNTFLLVTYLIGIITIVVLAIFARLMSKRTEYGNIILGKIRGFKKFLETAEKDKLEALVNQDPEYFYNILPYTYVLGVSDVWISNFESIAMKAPDWYYSNGAFDFIVFNNFINNTMRTAQMAMTSTPSSSSSGSSSSGFSGGGGSSGGGSGGGGGGSW